VIGVGQELLRFRSGRRKAQPLVGFRLIGGDEHKDDGPRWCGVDGLSASTGVFTMAKREGTTARSFLRVHVLVVALGAVKGDAFNLLCMCASTIHWLGHDGKLGNNTRGGPRR
jgi:hypothetical protein